MKYNGVEVSEGWQHGTIAVTPKLLKLNLLLWEVISGEVFSHSSELHSQNRLKEMFKSAMLACCYGYRFGLRMNLER